MKEISFDEANPSFDETAFSFDADAVAFDDEQPGRAVRALAADGANGETT